MKVFVYVSLVVCILGGVIYYLESNAKIAELGRIMFEVGLLVTLLRSAVVSYNALKV